jgi:outer membrane protein assembly factor BamB
MKIVICLSFSALLLAGCYVQPRISISDAAECANIELIWEYPVQSHIDAGLVEGGGLLYYFESAKREIIALNSKTGSLQWNYSHGKGFHHQIQYVPPFLFFEFVTVDPRFDRLGKSLLVGLDVSTGEKRIEIEIPRVGDNLSSIGTYFWLRGNVSVFQNALIFGTADGAIHQFQMDNGKELLSGSFPSAVISGPFLFEKKHYWVLESGKIVEMDVPSQSIEIVFDPQLGNQIGKVLDLDNGNIICGGDRGEVGLVSLKNYSLLWRKKIGDETVRPIGIIDNSLWVNHGVDVQFLDLGEGQQVQKMGFTGLLNNVYWLKNGGYVIEGISKIGIANESLDLQCRITKNSGSNVALIGDTLIYANQKVRAIKIESR